MALLMQCVLAASAGIATAAALEFVQPTNGAVFSPTDEIPIVLRGSSTMDVILAADVLANQKSIGRASFCCSFCPCARPLPGQETILQIPVVWDMGTPPIRAWQGWTNVEPGLYSLTAQAVGEKGGHFEATPISITVLDRTLGVQLAADGSVNLVIPRGSLFLGQYYLEVSEDARTWRRLGPFEPGNMAAFYHDPPPAATASQRFYRSVYLPAQGP